MAPKGKRKATSSASPVKTPRPKKRINLNGTTASTPSRSTRSQKAAAQIEQSQEEQPQVDTSKESLNNFSEPQQSISQPASLSSRLSISSFSLPFLSHTSSSSSSSSSVNVINASGSVFDRFVKRVLPAKSFLSSKFNMVNGTDAAKAKGKGKQRQMDEKDHLSAEESAQMIGILDTPVSIKAPEWRSSANGGDEGELSDSHSDRGVEALPGDQKDLSGIKGESEKQLESNDAVITPLSNLEDDQKKEAEEGSTSKESVYDSKSKDILERSSSPLEENGILHLNSVDAPVIADVGKADDEIFTLERDLALEKDREGTDIIINEGHRHVSKTSTEWIAGNQQEEHSHPHIEAEHDQSEQLESIARHNNVEEEPSESVLIGESDGKLKSSLREEEDDHSLSAEESTSADVLAEKVTEQVGHLTVVNDAETSEMSFRSEQGRGLDRDEVELDEEEEILIPSSREKRGVIDLTDSTSPEIELKALPEFIPLRQKSSGFFANGILAREKEGQEQGSSYSAARVIQQLGKRQVSSPSISSKVSHMSLSGFRKKDPIFSQARKSKARIIAQSKANDILTSLKRYVKMTMHTPLIDDMLKKRVAVGKFLGDETSEEEMQIRHLREILRRSTYSLRPARRQLKEQERLAHEAKMLKKRAMGILGRQSFPSSLSPDQEDFVLEITRKQGKIAQMVGAGVDGRDIAKLGPEQWLNDEVINFYTKLILKRSDEALQKRNSAKEAKKRLTIADYKDEADRTKDITSVRDVKRIWNGIWNVWTFTSFFWSKLTNEGYSGVRQWTRKVDIFTKDMILLPINLGQMHWVCAAINMRLCRFEYYDSLYGSNPKVFKALRSYLESEYADKKKDSAGPLNLSGWRDYYSENSPSQANGFDCGMFSCFTMEQISRRNPTDGEVKELNIELLIKRSNDLAEVQRESQSDEGDDNSEEEEEWNFSQSNMPYLRRRMIYEIAKTKLLD